MKAGKLRHRVTLQEFVEVVDEYGTPIGSGWQDVATVWAAVEPFKGEEYIQLQNTQAELTAKVTIRYLPGIKPAMRVLYGDRVFDIKSVIDPEERHRELQLMCVEKVA
ncbi:MAG: phage head closure protein [Bacillota bacterium]|jgi:SPP1 family predicted phage head-tail adaptor